MIPQWNTQYVQSDSSLDVPPPYFFPDVTVHGVIFEANMEAVQKYCDDFLNLGDPEERGFEYRAVPMWPYAQLLFLHYPLMISASQAQFEIADSTGKARGKLGAKRKLGVSLADRGTTTQNEVFVAMPVMRVGLGPKARLIKSELEWILPFIVVDQPWSCVCGREMLGLGKMMSNIHIGKGYLPGSFLGQVQMAGWREAGKGKMERSLPFLDVKTGPRLPSFRSQEPFESLATAFADRPVRWAMEKVGGLANLVNQASLGILPTTMRTVALKQYRDAVQPSKAVYQALVGCRSKYSEMTDLQIYDERDIQVTFNDVGSFHEIVDTILGPDPDGKRVKFPKDIPGVKWAGRQAKVVGGFRFKSNVDFDQMRVLYEFPIHDDEGNLLRPAFSDLTARWFRPIKGFFGPRPLS